MPPPPSRQRGPARLAEPVEKFEKEIRQKSKDFSFLFCFANASTRYARVTQCHNAI
jgi:hypothetical protein